MKRIFLALFLFAALSANSQIVINEVMYAPISPAKEWFELYNTSSSPVSIQNWKWRDAAQSNPVRTITVQSIQIPANSFAVVCEDSANFRSAFPLVTGIVIQSVGWNALNNTGDENVVLYNSSAVTVDSLTYNNSWGGSGGFSLERKNPLGPTNSSSNWGTSLDPSKGTPDRVNSLTPKTDDLILKSFVITPSSPLVGDTLKLDFWIKNIGLNAASGYSLNIYRDANFDSIPDPSELINAYAFTSTLNANDSTEYTYRIAGIDSGKKQYIGKVIYTPDQDTSNNMLLRSVTVGGQVVSTGMLINEIMYAPQSPEPEWIEIYNNSGSAINIKNWKIADSSSENSPITITSSDRIVNANDYLVIAKNSAILSVHTIIDSSKIVYVSSLPTYNNDKDKVIIFNNASVMVDEVSYKSQWGGSSRNSLERISFTRPSNDSTNWITSLDCEFSTPTRQNSFANIVTANRNDLIVNEIMFDPLTTSCEWFELYNRSGKYLNLNGWKASMGSYSVNIFDNCNYVLKPGAYLVVAADTTLYNRFGYLHTADSSYRVTIKSSVSLSNSGALIKITDVLNNTVDSVYYSPKWHNSNIADTKGYSLERISSELNGNLPSNWSSCADLLGGTPGKRNSIFVQNNKETSLSVYPNPFSPDGDGFEDFTIIKYKLKANTSQVRVKIFDVKGRVVRTLLNNQFSGNESQIIFDGKDDSGNKLRIGIYVVYLEAVDDHGGTLEQTKTTVVVAAKL
ncbi:MAG: lamin tail domain-containing protein [Bacteroidetes bacterium]|nr:lamin tail domain-containing protein [Bacteroidota bacterium]